MRVEEQFSNVLPWAALRHCWIPRVRNSAWTLSIQRALGRTTAPSGSFRNRAKFWSICPKWPADLANIFLSRELLLEKSSVKRILNDRKISIAFTKQGTKEIDENHSNYTIKSLLIEIMLKFVKSYKLKIGNVENEFHREHFKIADYSDVINGCCNGSKFVLI